MMEFSILPADKKDADMIARGIATALHIGEDDAAISFDSPDEFMLWQRIFTELAARDDTQYSYLNTLKAVDNEGNILGIIIGYDGADLYELRQQFIDAVKFHTGIDMTGMADETTPDEFYLDSLAVWPQFRGNGIGRALLKAAVERARSIGKPAGLLVDKSNPRARRLYESVGFKNAGDRPFVDKMMDHMTTKS